nr:ABC transporter permease subunit [Pseudohalocynthiibacter aestuariivivens]
MLFFFSRIGVESSAIKIILAHVLITLPYTIRTNVASMAGIGETMVEASLSLGAREGQTLRRIVLPLGRTGIATGFIFAFAFSMDDIAVTIFLTSPTVYTLPAALIANMKANFDLTIAAASVFLAGVALLVIIILDRIVGVETVMGQGIYRN